MKALRNRHAAGLSRAAAARRDLPAAQRIPYSSHLTEHLVRTYAGEYVQVIKLAGVSFESADDESLNTWHARLNVLWRNIASPQVAAWTHLVRRREHAYPPGRFPPGFAATLNERYRQRLAGETLMVNDLYLSLIYRPAPGAAQSLTLKALTRGDGANEALERADSLEACQKLRDTARAALDRYDPESLGLYTWRNRVCSSLLEFLGLLINGEWQRMPLARGPLNERLATSRLFFGTELIEHRTPTQMRWGAMLGIKEYPTPTHPGMFNALLAAPYPLLLTQSFVFVSKAAAQGLLQRQANRMVNAGDFAVSQAAELRDALDALTSNEFVMGEHHLTLQVMSEATDGADGRAERGLGRLSDDLAHARSTLADSGMTVAREDLALEAAFWAQLPACFGWRPRKSVITSRNFAAMAPFHNYPSGRAEGNHWGEALTLLVTSARSPYYFSLHASDPREPDGGSRKDTGHSFICGPTGSGKTVLIGFLVSMLVKHDATQIIFDKDRGLEILVRALGGAYLPLRGGEPTGFNPLQLPATAENVEFLKVWLRCLVRPRAAGTAASMPLTVRQEADLDQALHGTLALSHEARRLSRLVEFLDATDAEGMYARLSVWCASTGGDAAWVFDNAEDEIVPLLARSVLAGFDVTHFLENATIHTPVTLYLFHLVRKLLDGRRLVCWMDEFWRLLADPAFEGFAKDGPKTWRKLNGVMCLATQSPSDVLESAISRTIIEQTPTKIFFPNADAGPDYMEGFGLSEREFRLIKEELEPGSRQFLVKHGHHSVVCALDLKGFEAELAVISGRATTLELLERLIGERSVEPAQWLPRFQTQALAIR